MGLTAREQRTLSCIADELVVSDPGLASILAVFNRLTSNEEMPVRQRAGGSRRREPGHSHRRRGRTSKRRRWRQAVTARPVVTAWIFIGVALLTVAIVLSNIGHGADGRQHCSQSWSAGQLFPTVTCREPTRAVTSDRSRLNATAHLDRHQRVRGYLASDEASFVQGALLPVDGGRIAI